MTGLPLADWAILAVLGAILLGCVVYVRRHPL